MRVYGRYKNRIVREFTDESGDPCLELSTREGTPFLISKSDHEKICRLSWDISTTKHGKKYVTGYRKRLKRFVRLHRFIMDEEDPEVVIDHINSNGVDNRRTNLRKASYQQNSFNRVVSTRSSTGIKGVFYDKERGKYVARIQVGETYKNLGRFDTVEEAAKAYAAAAEKHYKEFARHTEVPSND